MMHDLILHAYLQGYEKSFGLKKNGVGGLGGTMGELFYLQAD